MYKYSLALALLATTVLAWPALAQPQPDKVRLTRHFQNRYLQRDWTMDEFILRRMYINLMVNANAPTKAVVT